MVFERRVPISKVSKQSKDRMGLSYQKKKSKRSILVFFLKKILKFFLLSSIVCAIVLAIYLYLLTRSLPDVTKISRIIPNETTKIYSVDGVILAELHKEENRIIVPYSRISDTIKKSVVAMEDARFYKHHGVDPYGILRAIVISFLHRSRISATSTITQQLARHLFLTKKRKISRKINEILLALKIERNYTKEEILEMYLNQVYWGHNAYGIESASNLYFNKNAKDLSVAESAMLTGILQAPEMYSPFRNYELAMRRKNIVLGRLLKTKVINKSQYNVAKAEKIELAERKKIKYKAPYFTSMIVDQLIEMYGEDNVYSSGLKVYTPLNYELQEAAEKAVYWAVNKSKAASLNFTQAAMLAIEANTGHILTMVGGYDFLNNQFNKTTQAMRQPGSAFKPFVYLTALNKKISPGTIFDDAPVTFNTLEGPYSPQNYSHRFDGRMPMRKALEKSKNVVAIKIIDIVKPTSVIETARAFGITTPLEPVLSMALGSQETSMMEITSAYGAFAVGGKLVKPIFILFIEDSKGIPLYKSKIQIKQVYNKNAVYALLNMMKGVVNYGTGRNARLPRPMAGKTGTTTDYRDAWFIGYTPQIVATAWVGNDDNTEMNRVVGGWIPAFMWKEYMKTALTKYPRVNFPNPRGMVGMKVCWDSGKRANEFCKKTTIEKYWVGYSPKDFCDLHTEITSSNQKVKKTVPSWINDFLN